MMANGLLDVRAVLFGDGNGSEDIASSMEGLGVLRAVTQADPLRTAFGDAVSSRAGAVVAGLLEMDLLDVLKLGWQKHARLRTAAVRTRETPGSEEVVDLLTHTIRSTHMPRLEVYFDETLIATVDFELELRIDVDALVAEVSDGRLVAVGAGQAELGAEFSCEGIPVKAVTRIVDLSARIELDPGVDLLANAAPD